MVRAELPGIDPENDVDISLSQGVLSIKGERRREETTNGERFFRSETHYGSFERQILVPDDVKPDDISASYRDGILEVVVPQGAAVPSPRKIPVRVGEHGKALSAEGTKE